MEKKCSRCKVVKPIEEFTGENGKVFRGCKRCRQFINSYYDGRHGMILSKLGEVFRKVKPRFLKNEPYCMRCGKPFNNTVSMRDEYTTKVIDRSEKGNGGILNHNKWKDFILCDSCLEDKKKGKKFNLVKKHNGKEVRIKEQTGIEDLTEDDKKILYKNYPHNELIKL